MKKKISKNNKKMYFKILNNLNIIHLKQASKI